MPYWVGVPELYDISRSGVAGSVSQSPEDNTTHPPALAGAPPWTRPDLCMELEPFTAHMPIDGAATQFNDWCTASLDPAMLLTPPCGEPVSYTHLTLPTKRIV